jgi:hypothetical protein
LRAAHAVALHARGVRAAIDGLRGLPEVLTTNALDQLSGAHRMTVSIDTSILAMAGSAFVAVGLAEPADGDPQSLPVLKSRGQSQGTAPGSGDVHQITR